MKNKSELNSGLLVGMFRVIRDYEVKNAKTQKRESKEMVADITRCIEKAVEKEMKGQVKQ